MLRGSHSHGSGGGGEDVDGPGWRAMVCLMVVSRHGLCELGHSFWLTGPAEIKDLLNKPPRAILVSRALSQPREEAAGQ